MVGTNPKAKLEAESLSGPLLTTQQHPNATPGNPCHTAPRCSHEPPGGARYHLGVFIVTVQSIPTQRAA